MSRISASLIEVVVDDLLVKILSKLPLKSLMRFKSLSQKWNSLISSPSFALQYNTAHGPNPAVGMFFHYQRRLAFDYININFETPTKPPFQELNFPEDPRRFWVQHSCNGLLLCCNSDQVDMYRRPTMSPIRKCCIYYPMKNCFTELPRPGIVNGAEKKVHGMTLAFDPVKSSSFKVVCVRTSEFASRLCQIEIYSTESGEWRPSGEPFREAEVDFDLSVYWNGSVYWTDESANEVLFFDVEQERLGKIAMTVVPVGHQMKKIEYFGVSFDHLHLVVSYDRRLKLIVYEMEKDNPDWFVKYHVDLTAAFTNRHVHAFTIFLLVRGREETAFLVMKICNDIVRFNLESSTSKVIYKFGDDVVISSLRPFEYIESLCVL